MDILNHNSAKAFGSDLYIINIVSHRLNFESALPSIPD